MRLSVVDLGTNTFNLLIAERDADGRLCVQHSEERPVFLGRSGIGRGLITSEAMERGLSTLREFVDMSLAMGVSRIMAYGTSALRNARNAGDFSARVKDLLQLDITILSGEEEAELILDGVRQAVTFTTRPMLVMDIGGGSIEFILATNKAVMWKHSFEIGATRLLERFSPSDPLLLEDYFRISSYIDAQLAPLYAVMDRHWPHTLVGSAGSFDTLAQLAAHEAGTTISSTTNNTVMGRALFDDLKEGIVGSTRAARARTPGIPDHRVDTLPLALLAMDRVVMHGIEEVRWSRYALKEGAAWRALQANPLIQATRMKGMGVDGNLPPCGPRSRT